MFHIVRFDLAQGGVINFSRVVDPSNGFSSGRAVALEYADSNKFLVVGYAAKGSTMYMVIRFNLVTGNNVDEKFYASGTLSSYYFPKEVKQRRETKYFMCV